MAKSFPRRTKCLAVLLISHILSSTPTKVNFNIHPFAVDKINTVSKMCQWNRLLLILKSYLHHDDGDNTHNKATSYTVEEVLSGISSAFTSSKSSGVDFTYNPFKGDKNRSQLNTWVAAILEPFLQNFRFLAYIGFKFWHKAINVGVKEWVVCNDTSAKLVPTLLSPKGWKVRSISEEFKFTMDETLRSNLDGIWT